MYYITEFGALRRKNGEFVSNFTKRFNKMYNKIFDHIKPIEASTKITIFMYQIFLPRKVQTRVH